MPLLVVDTIERIRGQMKGKDTYCFNTNYTDKGKSASKCQFHRTEQGKKVDVKVKGCYSW
jgi:hypothetical protein